MQEFPHHYTAAAAEAADGTVDLSAEGLPRLSSAPPAQFGGPGDRWSPETLLVGAVADCFVQTFRAVARASKLSWTTLRCDATGTLDRVDRVLQFTHFELDAHLSLPAGADPDQARRVLEKTGRSCLVSNSMKATLHLETHIDLVTG